MKISEMIDLLTRELLTSGDLELTVEIPSHGRDDRKHVTRVTKVMSLTGDYYVIVGGTER